MSTRLQGQLLLVGAVGAILGALLTVLLPGPDGPTGPGPLPANVVAFLSGVLLLAGLPALYRAQARQIGRIGFAGVVLLWIADVLTLLVLTGVQILDVAMPGVIAHPGGHGPPPLAVIPAIVGAVLILIGGGIVGVTTIRARIFARAIGWLILCGAVLQILTAPQDGVLGDVLANGSLVVLYAGLAWAGASVSFHSRPVQAAA